MRDHLRVWWYNNFRRHWLNWRFKRRHLAEWVAEGRDPNLFPMAGPVTVEMIEWARDRLRQS
jgi:hypothetical protein